MPDIFWTPLPVDEQAVAAAGLKFWRVAPPLDHRQCSADGDSYVAMEPLFGSRAKKLWSCHVQAMLFHRGQAHRRVDADRPLRRR